MLTKTAYLAFTQCPKQLWLENHEPDLAAPPDLIRRRRLRAGQAVDQRAREQFPDGRPVPYRPSPEDMAPLTAEAIAAGAETLFQATFHVHDLLVKVDILTRIPGGWHLIEVKSSTRYKPEEHLADVAFQWHVLTQAGLPLRQASLMHLNPDCRHPDLHHLFTQTDITADVRSVLPDVATDIDVMRQVITETATPSVPIGRHCRQPYACPFQAHCWQGVDGRTIYDVPYLKRDQEQQLEAAGIRHLTDIPPDFPLKDKRAAAFVQQLRQQQIAVDREAIRRELDTLDFPLYFFDFETIDYAIPAFTGCKPYQQVPFQYSCHVLTADGALSHCEYLHMDSEDPRVSLIPSLREHIGPSGHLVAYNSAFERTVLRQLAAQFPAHAPALEQMAGRLWDQLAVFRKHYQDYRFGGSNSLKSVLPVVVPSLSYQQLVVKDGSQAQVVWEEMITQSDPTTKSQLADQLRAYCQLDTLAMVEIHQQLQQL